MESGKTTYQYKPMRRLRRFKLLPPRVLKLPPLRLVRLLPAANVTDTVICKLFHTSLETKPDFEALSYTWGDLHDTVEISLHGRVHKITRNLDSALRHLRRSDRIRVFWVDALCINQADAAERSQQVSQMRHIYDVGGARRVVVWLGDENNAKMALEFCKRLQTDEANVENLCSPEFDLEWDACQDLFVKRRWWSRSWIIQEVVHAGEVVVSIGGLDPISMDELCDMYRTYTSMVATGKLAQAEHELAALPSTDKFWRQFFLIISHAVDVPNSIYSMRRQAKSLSLEDEAEYPPPLPLLVMNFREQDCTDARDKIYAFLGIGSREYNVPLDYELSKRTLYIVAARQFLVASLTFLFLVESPSRLITAQGLPSWVPDYTVKQGSIAAIKSLVNQTFAADEGFPLATTEPRYLDLHDCEILVLRGIYVAVITGILEVRVVQDDIIEDMGRLKLLRYDTNLSARHQDFVEQPPTEWHTVDSETKRPLVSHKNTSWGPIFSEVEDIIIVAVGSQVPLVLRKVGEDKYLFVGTCWLVEKEIQDIRILDKLREDEGFSDIMRGAACEGLPDDYEAELFRIY